jgi:hypothetical protein
MEYTLEAFPPQVLLDPTRVVVQTHTEKRLRTQLLVDWNTLASLLATSVLKTISVNVEGGRYICIVYPFQKFV